jgi:DNA polymerase II large subunit
MYFDEISRKVKQSYDLANDARKLGYDPEEKVDIPVARDMAERVEGLISAVAPQIIGSGVSKRIHELEKQYGALDWRVSFKIAEEVALEKFCKFISKKEAIEIGVRVGFAYHTLGTVASPLEGFLRIEFGKTKDNKEYFNVYFAGPVRSAGGTGASVAVLLTDYLRKKFGYAKYDPTEDEIKRLSTELYDYHERITNLQYLPSVEEIEFLGRHLPVQLNGDPSEKIEVSNYKDLPRIETNIIRNGVCLVLGEGIAQKAPKLWKQLSKWGKDFEMDDWFFLEEFLAVQKKIKAGKVVASVADSKQKITPDYTFIKDLVAGRPVLTNPLTVGGFRLRFGRSRTSGYSSYSIHPATMFILNRYIATGTQLKLERPGKATAVTSCDTIEGPIVKLKNGTVIKISSLKEIKNIIPEIEEILFLGDILINYGDFLNRAHILVPPGYCPEWWGLELEKATVSMFGSFDIHKLSDFAELPYEALRVVLQKPITTKIDAHAAFILSEKIGIPLHPDYTYYWSTISSEQFLALMEWFKACQLVVEENKIKKIVLPLKQEPKRVLEVLGVPHIVVNNEFVVIEKDDAISCAKTLALQYADVSKTVEYIRANLQKTTLEILQYISQVKIRDKAGIFIGARMGRPEKAKMRLLTGSPQVLFPVGKEGDRLRSFQATFAAGKVRADFPIFYCSHCKKETVLSVCLECDRKTKRMYFCKACGTIAQDTCPKHGKAATFRQMDIDINEYFKHISKRLNTKILPDLIKGVRGTSNKNHIPEHPLKGVLRAKHNIYVNKDGTTRYDMTQLGITHFKPHEIGASVEKLRELGYIEDMHGNKLGDVTQILELKPQDVILPACLESPNEGADKVLFRVAHFVDDLLTLLYHQKPFYNLKNEQDIVGHLVLALAPHTSAGIIGRIIGFSKTQGFFAHPMLHAATRRDLDGDEACVILLMDALLNFSRQFLPAHRGSVQDAPLVLTTRVIPGEVDDMIFDLDTVWRYPLEFYEAALEYKKPWEVQIETFGKRLNTPHQYEGLGFTHDSSDFNKGVNCSAYKLLPSMKDKLKGQMELARKIRAVNEAEVATLVIEKHFIKDIKGNLRKFSMQEFRCVKCNEIYRRPPLKGVCLKCEGKLIFTISEGSVIKYLEPSIELAKTYNLPAYLQHTLELTKRRIESVFGKDKEKQEGLNKWFG